MGSAKPSEVSADNAAVMDSDVSVSGGGMGSIAGVDVKVDDDGAGGAG